MENSVINRYLYNNLLYYNYSKATTTTLQKFRLILRLIAITNLDTSIHFIQIIIISGSHFMSHYIYIGGSHFMSHYTSVAAILCLIIHRWQPFYVSLYICGSHFMFHYTSVAAILCLIIHRWQPFYVSLYIGWQPFCLIICLLPSSRRSSLLTDKQF